MARKKKQDEEENNDYIYNEPDDTFGLPEIEYEPLKRDEPVAEEPEPVIEESTVSYSEETVYEEATQPEEVDQESYSEETEEPYSSSYRFEEEKPSILPKVLGILFILILAGGAAWYFAMYKPQKDKEEAEARRAQIEQAARDKEAEEARRLVELQAREAEQKRLDSLANLAPKDGEFETLDQRTGRYYVVRF